MDIANTKTTTYTGQTASSATQSQAQSQAAIQKTASTGLQADFQMFLTLFMAQLENQDPTDPMETTEQLSQLAGFSAVEQAVKTNGALDKILTRLEQKELQGDIAYLGKTVETTSDQISLTDEGSTFYIDDLAANLPIITVIKSQNGETIRTLKSTSSEGRTAIAWDGLNENGSKTTNGLYRVEVSTPGEEDQSLMLEAVVRDTVKNIRTVDGLSTLGLANGLAVTSSRIKSITAS